MKLHRIFIPKYFAKLRSNKTGPIFIAGVRCLKVISRVIFADLKTSNDAPRE